MPKICDVLSPSLALRGGGSKTIKPCKKQVAHIASAAGSTSAKTYALSEPFPTVLLGHLEAVGPVLACVRRSAWVAPHARAP